MKGLATRISILVLVALVVMSTTLYIYGASETGGEDHGGSQGSNASPSVLTLAAMPPGLRSSIRPLSSSQIVFVSWVETGSPIDLPRARDQLTGNGFQMVGYNATAGISRLCGTTTTIRTWRRHTDCCYKPPLISYKA